MMMSQFAVGGGSGRIGIGSCGGSGGDDLRSTGNSCCIFFFGIVVVDVMLYRYQNQHQL